MPGSASWVPNAWRWCGTDPHEKAMGSGLVHLTRSRESSRSSQDRIKHEGIRPRQVHPTVLIGHVFNIADSPLLLQTHAGEAVRKHGE